MLIANYVDTICFTIDQSGQSTSKASTFKQAGTAESSKQQKTPHDYVENDKSENGNEKQRDESLSEVRGKIST